MTAPPAGLSIEGLERHPRFLPLVLRWRTTAFPHVDASAPEHDPRLRVLDPERPEGPPRTLLALEDGVPIGFVAWILFARPGRAFGDWVDALYVEPHRRGLGIASRLLAAVEGEARARGVRLLRAYTDRLALYRRAGWEDDVPGLPDAPALRVMRRRLEP